MMSERIRFAYLWVLYPVKKLLDRKVDFWSGVTKRLSYRFCYFSYLHFNQIDKGNIFSYSTNLWSYTLQKKLQSTVRTNSMT